MGINRFLFHGAVDLARLMTLECSNSVCIAARQSGMMDCRFSIFRLARSRRGDGGGRWEDRRPACLANGHLARRLDQQAGSPTSIFPNRGSLLRQGYGEPGAR